MAKQFPDAVQEIITNITPADVEPERELFEHPKDHIGVLVSEQRTRKQQTDAEYIPLYYEKQIEVEGEKATLRLHIQNDPGPLEPEIYYPAVEWRLTQDTLDEQDYWPDYKQFDWMENGQPARLQTGGPGRVGMPLRVRFFVVWNVTECSEDEDGQFFPMNPIKGSDIQQEIENRKGRKMSLVMGASRRRVA